MAQHSGGIRRPRKSYLISLLLFPSLTLALALSLIHIHTYTHTFFSHPSFTSMLLSSAFFPPLSLSLSLSYLRLPHLLSSSFHFFSPLRSLSYPSAILPTPIPFVSLRFTLDSARAHSQLSLSLSHSLTLALSLFPFSHSHTRIHAASTQYPCDQTRTLLLALFRAISTFFFFLSPPLGFVCSSE